MYQCRYQVDALEEPGSGASILQCVIPSSKNSPPGSHIAVATPKSTRWARQRGRRDRYDREDNSLDWERTKVSYGIDVRADIYISMHASIRRGPSAAQPFASVTLPLTGLTTCERPASRLDQLDFSPSSEATSPLYASALSPSPSDLVSPCTT